MNTEICFYPKQKNWLINVTKIKTEEEANRLFYLINSTIKNTKENKSNVVFGVLTNGEIFDEVIFS